MTPAAPAVALLFDDLELGSQLREALNERGAHIVHEGAVSSLTRELLEKVGADVLVVNLDDVADDALDNLYEAIDGTNRKVVFNDGQASSALTGWDRARWARHLALKVFEIGEVDPPRPENARGFESTDFPQRSDLELPAGEVAAQGLNAFANPRTDSSVSHFKSANSTDTTHAGVSSPVVANSDMASSDVATALHYEEDAPHTDPQFVDATTDVASSPASGKTALDTVEFADSAWSSANASAPSDDGDMEMFESFSFDDLPASVEGIDDFQGTAAREESDDLAAELEALLASGDLADDDESPSSTGLRFSTDDEPPMLHDGHFGLPRAEPEGVDGDDPFAIDLDDSFNKESLSFSEDEPRPSSATPPVFQLDQLELTPRLDAVTTTVNPASSAPVHAAAEKSVSAPSDWSLIDVDAAPAPSTKPSPSEFGIEKMSAADFLAPDVENAGVYSEPVMNLDLVSMEEAIAPKAYDGGYETRLDEPDSALAQVVVLGAVASGAEAVGHFLSALPGDTRLFFLHTQHFGDLSADEMVAALASHSALPVRLATQGWRAKGGEVLVVPPGQQLRLRRDGMVDLQPGDTQAAKEPSIDASFSMAAGVFTRDALAIVFAGRGNDGVAGSQAVKDRGGKVWVESSSSQHSADIVSGIAAERLVSFSGSPHELAAHLIEVYP